MADLPSARVELVRPFLKVGVDYAGPFSVTPIRRRGQRSTKNYVCIFICLATRAVHIELVFNLTTEDFLAALKRMTSRRGLCSDIYSDCGSNFVGANKELCHLYKFLCSNTNGVRNYLLKDKINWHFNPPGAPHFGGIWEAAVKSMKVHLRKVLGNTIPTIDEFNTLLIEIEGLLNSRPLCRSTAEDIDCLTPAHFLIGHPLTIIPDANLCEDRAISYEKRWKMIQQLSQNFWTRWHREYLVTLQERTKWNRRQPNLVIGDIAIIKDDSLVAKRWVLGKVIELYAGNDGLVRIAKLKTQVGEVKRPVQKLCKLPIGEPEDSRGAGCLRLDKNSTA